MELGGTSKSTSIVMSDTDSMPSLVTISPPPMDHNTESPTRRSYNFGELEVAKFRFCSILAQIEIASCFRNDIEPLFHLFSHVLTTPRNP